MKNLPLFALGILIVAFSNSLGQSTSAFDGRLFGGQKEKEFISNEIFKKIVDTTETKLDFPAELWNSESAYYLGDIVMYNNQPYESLIDNNTTSPDNLSTWDKFHPVIRIKNLKVTYKIPNGPYLFFSTKLFLENYNGNRDSLNRIIIDRPVTFENCELNFDLGLEQFNFKRGLSFQNCTLGKLNIKSIAAREVLINNCNSEYIGIQNSQVSTITIEGWSPVTERNQIKPHLNIKQCSIGSIGIITPPNDLVTDIIDSRIIGMREKSLYMGESARVISKGQYTLRLKKTSVGSPNTLSVSSLQGNFIDIIIDSCVFNSNFNFYASKISNKLYLTNSTINGLIAINNATLPTDIKVRWTQLSGNKISTFRKSDNFIYKFGFYTEDEEFIQTDTRGITNLDAFEDIMKSYQILYYSYKDAGDIESANSCYAEMKDVQTDRLAFLHDQQGTFKSFFRLKLSQLMKVYTEHGTDPAKAIVVSVWVILSFAIFFFFFPSDWDVTSKSELVNNFNSFIKKNEKGYIKPFIILVGGIIASLINALTLSLNAFTTLGFGNIPTHGIAKYFCVLEGFIGWFLLSIFTVSLINQVLS